MNRIQLVLLFLVSLEVVGAGGLVVQRLYRPTPPVPDLAGFNPYTAGRLRALIESVQPDVAEQWADLGEAYLAHGFFPESEACLRRACELAPDDAALKYRWSHCLGSMGRMDESRARLEEALRAGHPAPADCWYLIGRIHLRQENSVEARGAFERARDLPAARFELAKLAVRGGDPEAGLALLTPLEKELPGTHAVHLLRAQAEAMLGHDKLAGNYLELSELSFQQLPSPTHEFRKQILARFESCAVSQLVQQGMQLLSRSQFNQAETLLREAMGSHWESEIEDLRATLAFNRGDLDGHVRQLEAIIDRDGTDSYRQWRLGLARAAARQPAAAVTDFRAAATLDTDARATESLDRLAMLTEGLGDEAQARRYAARFRCAVARQLFRQAQLGPARSALQEAMKLDDQLPHAWFYLGEVERFSGNRDAARDAYDRCLKLNPNHGRALAARQRIDPR